VKKSILKISGTPEEEDSLLFAISSHESDIYVSLLINRILAINLSLYRIIDISRKEELLKFPVYFFENDDAIEKYYLFVNRIGMQYLVPGIKKIDYLLLIQSEGNLATVETKLAELKSNSGILALHKLDSKSIRPLLRYID